MQNTTQPQYHAARLAPFIPTHEHQLRHMESVATQGHSQRTLYVRQFAPAFEGSLQVVDRFMLGTVSRPPAQVFEVHNTLRQPVSKYLCSYSPIDLNKAAQICAQAVAHGPPPTNSVGQLIDHAQQPVIFPWPKKNQPEDLL